MLRTCSVAIVGVLITHAASPSAVSINHDSDVLGQRFIGDLLSQPPFVNAVDNVANSHSRQVYAPQGGANRPPHLLTMGNGREFLPTRRL